MDTISKRKMKPKTNRTSKQGPYVAIGADACQTPVYALGPILPYLSKEITLWESACGDTSLSAELASTGHRVIATDLLEGAEYDFFKYEPVHWDVQVTNPPYSIKFPWLKRSYELGKPFALLVPVDILGAKKAQVLLQQYGFEIMLLDTRVDFIMPNKGLSGAGAQFATMWLCWNLLPEKIMFGSISQAKAEFKGANKGRGILPPISAGLGNTTKTDQTANRTEDIKVFGQPQTRPFNAGASRAVWFELVDWLRQHGSRWV
jgi:hypothetical protein